jgi:secreted trypsin-like serine protease
MYLQNFFKDPSSEPADQLQKLQMTSIPNLICSLMHIGTPEQGNINNESICVIGPRNAGIRGGDSGSPIVYRGKIVGVASWIGRRNGTTPSVFMRVSTHYKWIQQNM